MPSHKVLPFSSVFFRLLICLFCFASIAANGTVRAQGNRRTAPDSNIRVFQVRGSVRSSVNDMPIEMVRVDLKKFTGETVSTVFTRSNGDFEFNSLPSGEYIIEVNHQGYEPLREKVEIMNASRVGLYLFLRPVNTPGFRAETTPVSARELTIPKKALEYYHKGMEQLVLKSSPEASLRHFDKALGELPTYYEAHHMRGVAYFQLSRFEEARRDFQASLDKSNHKYAEPHFGLAALLTNDKKFSEAVEIAREGLAIDGKSWRGHYELARSLSGLNQLEEAAKSIAEARLLKPEFADIYLISANINMKRQNGGEALLGDLDEYLRLKPDGPMADQARKMREDIRNRIAAAQAKPQTPLPQKKPHS